MSWILPGTVLRVDSDSPAAAEETLSAMFLTGGLVLSQGHAEHGPRARHRARTGCAAAL